MILSSPPLCSMCFAPHSKRISAQFNLRSFVYLQPVSGPYPCPSRLTSSLRNRILKSFSFCLSALIMVPAAVASSSVGSIGLVHCNESIFIIATGCLCEMRAAMSGRMTGWTHCTVINSQLTYFGIVVVPEYFRRSVLFNWRVGGRLRCCCPCCCSGRFRYSCCCWCCCGRPVFHLFHFKLGTSRRARILLIAAGK